MIAREKLSQKGDVEIKGVGASCIDGTLRVRVDVVEKPEHEEGCEHRLGTFFVAITIFDTGSLYGYPRTNVMLTRRLHKMLIGKNAENNQNDKQ